MVELSDWARRTPGGREAYRVLGELDVLVLAEHPRVRSRVRTRAEAAMAAVARSDGRRRGAAERELAAAASAASALPPDETARLRADVAAALGQLERRGVLDAATAQAAADAPLGSAAAALLVAGAIPPPPQRKTAPATARPADRPAEGADPGAVAGAVLVSVPWAVAVLVAVGAIGADPWVWVGTAAVVAGGAVLAGTAGRGGAAGAHHDRLGARGLVVLAVVAGVGTVASVAVALTDPDTGRAFGAVLALQAMTVVGISSLAARARRRA